MKTPGHESNTVHMPPELLAEARQAASEEQRHADELVSDDMRRYLHERRHNGNAPCNNSARLKKKTLSELFAVLRGSDIDLSRNPSTGRPVNL